MYLLTIVDYATRYPEAIPLSNIRAETVVDALIQVFARIGLPREIVHDQGTNFMSKVMKSICSRLHITQIATSARHQQTNGMTERFHGTLKNMMRSLTEDQMKHWDEYIPSFLFAYREVPCATTGYAPFELLYGRKIRGPLSILKDMWVSSDSDPNDVVTHLLSMRKRIPKLLQDANENTRKSQKKMKKNYDKNATPREFKAGERVLVFLPEGPSKFDNKWQGPYVVKRRINRVNYEIELPDKCKSKRIVHVNLCKIWYNREQETQISKCVYVTGVVHEISSETSGMVESGKTDEGEEFGWLDDNLGPSLVQTQTWRDVEINKELSHKQRGEVMEVIHAYSYVFSDLPGRTHLVKHHIQLHTKSPIRQQAYRVPHALRDRVKQELDSMLKLGIIEPTISSYASPIVIVSKSDETLRLCTDFRKLNKNSVFDPYSMPRIDEILDEIAGAHYISTFDLTKGFYQVPIDRESRDKTSFVTPFGQYRYTVLPFGLQNSSSVFQRLMDCVLKGCESFSRAYIDDICIFSKSWSEHIAHLQAVLHKLEEAGLKAKPKKCKFAFHQIAYLGHKIGGGVVTPIWDIVEGVQNFPQPLTKRNVRAFLGLTGYYRKFVPNFAKLAKPLTDLTRKDLPNAVHWDQACEQAFQSLKDKLTSQPILYAPDFNKTFVVQTDASNFGIGAVLSQTGKDGKEHPVAYISRKLSEREQRFSVPEKEALAIIWAVAKLKYYLIGVRFKIFTDHQALKWLEKTKGSNNRLLRWSLALQQFSFDVQYRRGCSNGNADGLSRM